MRRVLLVHPDDDMVVALNDIDKGESVVLDGITLKLLDSVDGKHKFVRRDCRKGELLRMYGQVVGRLTKDLSAGQRLTTTNLQHFVDEIVSPVNSESTPAWSGPDLVWCQDLKFSGFHRPDGRVGVRNHWIVVPLVFCQNRNIDVLREALLDQLGYSRPDRFRTVTERLIKLHSQGASVELVRESEFRIDPLGTNQDRIFPNVDGVKFLTHEGGCGGLYQDALTLCGLLAGYINHPNVAGATVLSLGCQKSQIADLQNELHKRNPNFKKPLFILEQQKEGTESTLLEKALKFTFSGLMEANLLSRAEAPLSEISLGVECGGSDGFSGISANPAIGVCSDHVVGLGGSVILSEFPELSGCENDLVSRCQNQQTAQEFLKLMRSYEERTERDGGGFDQNPSPGNVADGLITDAMKSAGASRKGGTSPVVDVLDYPEPIRKQGLNLLCTPGGDVESTTAMAGSGATIQLFSTGLGTPTGNAVTPVVKISSNSELAKRMPDIIDVDAGTIIEGTASIDDVGKQLLRFVVETANGTTQTCSEKLGQEDFIPWRRGISI